MLSLVKRLKNQIQALSADHSEKHAFSLRTDGQTNCLHAAEQDCMTIARLLPSLSDRRRRQDHYWWYTERPQAERSACSDLAHVPQQVTQAFCICMHGSRFMHCAHSLKGSSSVKPAQNKPCKSQTGRLRLQHRTQRVLNEPGNRLKQIQRR